MSMTRIRLTVKLLQLLCRLRCHGEVWRISVEWERKRGTKLVGANFAAIRYGGVAIASELWMGHRNEIKLKKKY